MSALAAYPEPLAVPEVDTEWLSEVNSALAAVVAPRVAGYDRDGVMPQDVLDVVTEVGLWAPFVPPGYGGRGCSDTTLGRAHELVGAIDTSLRSILTAHIMVVFALLRHGSNKQREHWLPRLVAGDLAAYCLTGGRSGSAADVSETTAVPDGRGGWILSGYKRWATSAQRAAVFLVFARTPAGAMVALLVPRDTPRLRTAAIPDMLGARSNLLGEVVLDKVEVGSDALIGPDGWTTTPVMTECLALGRYSVACGETGLITACLRHSLAYAESRMVPARRGCAAATERLNEQPQIQALLSRMTEAAQVSRLLIDSLTPHRNAKVLDSWLAKWTISRYASQVAAAAVQLQGAHGCTGDNPVARFYRDVALHRIIEGTDQLQERVVWELGRRLVMTR
jgi:alkylation response protein AidB-like acyl-CoA dehydrogenase